MSGAISSRREFALYLLVWLLLGIGLAGVVVSIGGSAWIYALLFAIPLALVYAFATRFSAFYLCRALPLTAQNPFRTMAVLGFAALLSGALWTAVSHLWNNLWLTLGNDWAGIAVFAPALTWMIFGLGVLLYGLSVTVHYLLIEFERVRQAQRRELESKMMAQEAELRMLRSQIDPHFLFNSLNSISALTTYNPPLAREMTQQLADFFRYSLGFEAHKKVRLEAEMRLVMYFLGIEKVRFAERLQIETDIGDDAAACLVPPMIIQPLVENAVKHGIGHLTQGGTIRIRARCVASGLQIRVENDIDADLPQGDRAQGDKNRRHGIGLNNVRQRLLATYQHHASIYWQRTGQHFIVELLLPAEMRVETGNDAALKAKLS
jgi:two-component system, LytTR family, sensor histidine kinase AlgZ